MTRLLGVGLFLLAVFLPVAALGGNPCPTLYLEVYGFEEEPDTVPDYVCTHAERPYVGLLPCWALRLPYSYYYIPVHIARVFHVCPHEMGPACVDHGGFSGVPFGIQQVAQEGAPLVFQDWNPCPGFLRGVSIAGEPAACGAYSTQGCRDWVHHTGYLVYWNAGDNTASQADFSIVPSADLGHNKVINCEFKYDENTYVGGGARVSDSKTIGCIGDAYAVEESTWGSIKALFR